MHYEGGGSIYLSCRKKATCFCKLFHIKKINGDSYIANSSYSQKYMYPSRDNNWNIEN